MGKDNNFPHFNIPWMIDIFLFFYLSLHYGQTSQKFCSHWVKEFHRRSCMYYRVKPSNVFYLCLLWSLLQVVTKCLNNYCFIKNMFPLQTLTNKTPACKQNLRKHSLDGINLDTTRLQKCIVRKWLHSSLNLFILQKFSNSQLTTLAYLSSRISNTL